MKVQFTNPAGRLNTADLTSEQIERLKADKDYQVMGISPVYQFFTEATEEEKTEAYSKAAEGAIAEQSKYDFELPAVPKVRIHRKEFTECESCSA